MKLYLFSLIFIANTSFSLVLNISIEGIDSIEGLVPLAIHNRKETYLNEKEKPFKIGTINVKNKIEKLSIEVENGIYAVTLFHDLNQNNILDTNFLGIPKEPFGFSNNTTIIFGPPSFDESSFTVETDKSITIQLKSIL